MSARPVILRSLNVMGAVVAALSLEALAAEAFWLCADENMLILSLLCC